MDLAVATGELANQHQIAALWRHCLKVGRMMGFRTIVYACPPPYKKPTDPATVLRYQGMTVPEFQSLVFGGLIAGGHLTSTNSLVNARPFRWTDLVGLSSRKSECKELLADANRQGLDDGWIFPLFGPQGRVGLGSFGKPATKELMDTAMGDRLHVFAQMAHLRFCQLTPNLFGLEKTLSKREMQIIAWTAAGKSNSEISTILNISENSIDSYMRRAFAKLDVHDRTSAAVKAISIDLVRT
ncbi:helix-turn-helix transcriptional regulator [Parasphingorhabdus sp.]|uniref:helix-turn-helix transcriptional regulator n=1 Tax=Parasphingorhabdus sp. TaxID=2709688 RepID=UPI0030018462